MSSLNGLLNDGSFAVRPRPKLCASRGCFACCYAGSDAARNAVCVNAARYVLTTSADSHELPCELGELLSRIDYCHAEPLRALEVGEEHEIPQFGMPNLFVKRVS